MQLPVRVFHFFIFPTFLPRDAIRRARLCHRVDWKCRTWKWRTNLQDMKMTDQKWQTNRGRMLNLYSASNVRRLCALLCPAISFPHFHVLHFHVRHFHVLQFHVLQVGSSFSRPAISCPANWSVNFTSVIFTYSIFSAPMPQSFLVRRFHVLQISPSFSRPAFSVSTRPSVCPSVRPRRLGTMIS